MHLTSIIALFLFVLPGSLSQHVGSLRRSDTQTLPEDSGYWDRLLEEVEGSMDTSDDGDPRVIPGMVVVRSLFSFEDTYNNLITALEKAPVTLVAEIPHSDAAASVGLPLEPNKLAVFGNPALGTPLMQENRQVGIDLPQKMLIWQEADENVFAGYNSVPYLEFRHEGIEDAEMPLATIAGALLNFASAASGVTKEEIQVKSNIDLESTGVITEVSDADFETTWERLVAAIERSPANIAFTVDHSANAQQAGLSLPPTRLVVFGNPVLGTPLMQVSPTAGIDLPLKILVWKDDNGSVQVTTNDIDFIESRHMIEGVNDGLNRINGALQNFMTAATDTQV